MRSRILFIASLGTLLFAPLASAQQRATPVVGVVGSTGVTVEEIREALAEQGLIDGKNVVIETRGEASVDEQVKHFVGRGVAVIATTGNVAARAARAATDTIPVVFSLGGDPVALGLAASLNRPGGNVTGVSSLTTATEAKRLEILAEIVPGAGVIAVLVNPHSATTQAKVAELQAAAVVLGRRLRVFPVSTALEIDEAITAVRVEKIRALDFTADVFFDGQSARVGAVVAKHQIPAIGAYRSFAFAGGLVSYGSNSREQSRLQSRYIARVLRGEKPADMPIEQMSRIEMLLNLKAAQALGLTVPLPLLGRADEVIE